MSTMEASQRGYDIDTQFRETGYATHLKQHPRWSRFMPEGISPEEWRHILYADSDGLDQARLLIRLGELFIEQDTENTSQLSSEEKELLFIALAAQNWGKSFDDETGLGRDISYEFITSDDIDIRSQKFHTVFSELLPDIDIKRRFIVERTIYDKSTKLGSVFDAIRRLNCLRTACLAYDRFTISPDKKGNENLGALSASTLSNQLMPLITYAEKFAPVKKALEDASSQIEAILNDEHLLSHPFINQQSRDAIERTRIIWERSHGELSTPNGSKNKKNGLLSDESSFEYRYIRSQEDLIQIVEGLRAIGASIVLTSGSFDLVHIGHAAYIEKASQFGDVLIVGVDSDAKIKKRKGPNRPIVGEEERLRLLTHLRGVDFVTLKDPDEARWNLIRLVHPDVLIVTAETYTPKEIHELEDGYCKKVVVLEPQATTSTGAQIRKIEIDAVGRSTQSLGTEVLRLLAEHPDAQEIIKPLINNHDQHHQ